MKILINGSLGSGKTRVAKALAARIGYEYYSTGARFRALAEEMGVTLARLGEIAEKDRSIDDYIDAPLKEMDATHTDMVIDSRMAPFFVKDSVKIFLDVSDREGARRIHLDKARGAIEQSEDEEQALEYYRARRNSEIVRYKTLYGVDLEDRSPYDLVIDTTEILPDQVLDKLIEFLENNSR